MKKITKIMLGSLSVSPLIMPLALVSCVDKKAAKIINDKISELTSNAKDAEGKEIKNSSPIDKLNNEVAQRTINEAIQRVRKNNLHSSDKEKLQEGLFELEECFKLATKISKAINTNLNVELENIKKSLEKIKDKNFENAKEHIQNKIKELKQEITTEFNKVNEGLNKKPGSYSLAAKEIDNTVKLISQKIEKLMEVQESIQKIESEYKYTKKNLEIIKDDLFKDKEYAKAYELAYKFAENYLKNSKTIEPETLEFILNSLKENGKKIYDESSKLLKFSNYDFSFKKLANLFDEKNGFLKEETFKEITGKDKDSEEYKTLKTLSEEYKKLYSTTFDDKNSLKNAVEKFAKEIANHLAKLFNIVFNSVKDSVIKEVKKDDIKSAIESYKNKDYYLASYFSEAKGYKLGRSKFTLFDYKETNLKKFLDFARNVIRISTKLENNGIDHANGASITSYDEATKKLTIEFVLVNTLLSKDKDKKQVLVNNDAEYKIELENK